MPVPNPPTQPPADPIALDEFCRLLSLTDRRYALIGGFHLTLRRAGRLEDTEAAYRDEFTRFAK